MAGRAAAPAAMGAQRATAMWAGTEGQTGSRQTRKYKRLPRAAGTEELESGYRSDPRAGLAVEVRLVRGVATERSRPGPAGPP